MMESALTPTNAPHHTKSFVNNSNSTWSVLLSGDPQKFNHTVALHHHFYNSLLGVFLGLLSLITVIMNVLVLYAVKKENSLHTVGNLYIVSLSVADLIVGTTVMPLNLVYLLEDEWKLGRAVCQFWLIMDYVASTASIFSLFILCLDRYRSVRQPLKYLKYRTWGKASVMISGAWLLSMMWIIPILGWRSFTHVDLKPEEENKCDTDFRFVTWFKIITAVFNFYLPSVLMLWFYRHIYLAVRQHLKERERIIHLTDSFGENENGQNAQMSVKSDPKSSKRDCEIIMKRFKQHNSFVQKAVDQKHPLGGADKTKKASSRSHRKIGVKCQQTSFLAIKRKRFRLVQKVKNCTLSPEVRPQNVTFLEGNNESKLQASLNECDAMVPKSVNGTHALSWNKEEIEGTHFAPHCTPNVSKTWQKFIGRSRHRIQSLKIHKEHKAAKQLGFIIAAFFLCWIPYFIIFMVMAFCRECVHHDLHMFTIWLGYINSTLNPFIYPLCNGNFIRVFKNILKLCL